MKNKFVGKLSSLSAIAFFFLSPFAGATTLNNDRDIAGNHSSTAPLQLARSFCPDSAGGTPQVAFYETNGFWIYICTVEGLFYHGIEKGSGNYVTLPAYVEEGTGYVAVNGNYTYIVNGATLAIYEGRTLIQEEYVW
ncbi:hypothetical protein IQ235_07330 [Oscillatoriales cyanobacterium LEGE 11467]|uniref:Uncharacterized protein n=1 Tax=Zarconia navalis LEGE 11467 TaxID=1828826 RepID=A0A928VZM4_9CYAN|nr:hypothetical protein [Zarconia navalis]MBE9040595.1 hypothetical protein [Zarconia navalis LEGE 11467]